MYNKLLTTAAWVEETEGNTKNWYYFIFPNMYINRITSVKNDNNSQYNVSQTRSRTRATVIQLFHGLLLGTQEDCEGRMNVIFL